MSRLKFILGASLIGAMAWAPMASALTATQRVEREVVRTTDDGSKIVEREAASQVTPGETVVYTLDFTNDRAEPASNLKLAMPVPSDLQFIEGSADSDAARVLYSTDGGQSFASRQVISVAVPGGGTRQATVDDITHIQWTITGPVAPGETGAVAFKGRLR